MITANQYSVSKQTIQNKHIKINVLNFNYQTVAEISGNVTSGSITIDASSDIRRTCQIECVVTDSSFNIGVNKYIWFDKYVQILIGIDDIYTGETVWFNQGIYIIDEPSYLYDAISHTLNFTGLDLMAKLTGQRNGYIYTEDTGGVGVVVEQNSNVRQAIIMAVSELGGFSRYVVDECMLTDGTIQTVPYDITVEQGSTIYELLTQLRDILPYYEIYFDVDGVFHYHKIPTGENEPTVADDNILNEILISETLNIDFASVKNVIEVFGYTPEVSYTASEVIIEQITGGNIIHLYMPDLFADELNDIFFRFVCPTDVHAIGLYINDLTEYTGVLLDYTTQEHGNPDLKAGQSYIILLSNLGVRPLWKLYPDEQFHAIIEDDNSESPFYVNGTMGKIYQPLCGGEYDNLVGNEMCYERAKYELYKATNLQNSLSLNCVPTYYFDVNQLIHHAFANGVEQVPYLIQSINIDLSVNGEMGVTAIRYYPFYQSL